MRPTAILLILSACTAMGQTITDVTPRPSPPPESPPTYEVALDAQQAADVYAKLLPLLRVPDGGPVPIGNMEVSIEHGPAGEPASARVMVGLTLDGKTLSSIRALVGPAWGLPADARARPISRVETVVTNTGAARVIIEFR